MTWVASAVAVAGTTYKLYQANQQDTAAKRQKPTNYVPPAALDNQKLAQQQANATTYAGQSADEARNDKTVSNAIGNVQRNARSATDILNSAANIEGGLKNKMNNDIASRYQNFKQNALGKLMAANSNVAGFQNQDQQQFLNYQRQLEGAAMQNRYGAVNDLTGIAAQTASLKGGYGGGGYGGSYGIPNYWNRPSSSFWSMRDYPSPNETPS